MVDAGTVFCYKCGKYFSGLTYYNGELGVMVNLKRSLLGKRFVELDPDTNEEIKNSLSVSLTQTVKNFAKEIKNEIDVDVTQSDIKEKKQFTRCCPHCIKNDARQTPILQNLGLLPTYIIGVMGAPAVGKSCWIHSLSVTQNFDGIRTGNSLYRIEPITVNKELARIQKTNLDSMGETNALVIIETATNKQVAAVLLMDMAGEMFSPENRKRFVDTAAYSAFQSGKGFDGVDAVLFMDSPEDSGLVDAYNQVRETNVLTNKPVAYVLNKADTLFDTPPSISVDNSEDRVPLFTKNTFSDFIRPYAKEKLANRIALETFIAKNLKGLAKKILNDNKDSAGFIIKTCEPVSEAFVSFTDSMNVMDPLVWILNKLDIFPI
ncbi:MAG: hypothetical protein U0M42_03210 [Acutalibacteraceae bacterium]|nr:hypothetical protein [Acutalibacteraceae bacterium]